MTIDINPKQVQRRFQKRLWMYGLVYLFWFLAIIVSGIVFLGLHSVIEQWYVALKLRPSAHKVTSRFYLFFGAIVWLAFIFFAEGYFREGITKRVLLPRLMQVFISLFFAVLLVGIAYILIGPFLGVNL